MFPLATSSAGTPPTCPCRPGAHVLQNAPLSFDVSVQEIFATFADGGTLVLIDESLRRDPPAHCAGSLADQHIARLFLTPVLLYRLAELLRTAVA